MLVAYEKFTRLGSCVVMTYSMWKRSARNLRSGVPEELVQAVTGRTIASVPFLESRILSARGVKKVRMLLTVSASPADRSLVYLPLYGQLVRLHAFYHLL